MKLLKKFPSVITAAWTTLGLIGCSPVTNQPPPPAACITFSEKSGLSIPENTAKFIGLQVTEVKERNIAASLKFSAQVYRVTAEGVLASGSINPAEASKLAAGQTVSIQNNAASARIVSVLRTVEKSNGQVEVLLAIASSEPPLTAGTTLTVTAPLVGEQNAVSVPRSALLQTIEGDFVYAVSGEHFIRTAVKLGGSDGEFVAITDGLYAGDQIVVKPVMALWMAELQTLRGGKSCCAGH